MDDVREQPGTSSALNPTALAGPDLARLLSAAGGQVVTVDTIDADIAGGAPTNMDGSLNVIHYGAWLLRGLEHGFEAAGLSGAERAGQMTFEFGGASGATS